MNNSEGAAIAPVLDERALRCLIRSAAELWRHGSDDLSAYQLSVLALTCSLLDTIDECQAGGAGPDVAVPVWVLIRWDRRTPKEVSVHGEEDEAYAALAPHVRSSWGNVGNWHENAPGSPPEDDQAAVELYYGPDRVRGDEGYSLDQDAIHLRV